MKQFKGRVAESWKPTFENVTREFITDALYRILFSDDLPNFGFDFRESKAIDFIEEILVNNVQQYDPEKARKIVEKINQNVKVMKLLR